MLILGIHTGHDAGACLFKNGQLLAYCKEERLSRVKNDGKRFDLAAVDEVLAIADLKRRDIDAVSFTRKKFPFSTFKQVQFSKRLRDIMRSVKQDNRDLTLATEMKRRQTLDEASIINELRLKKLMKLRPDCQIHYVNHDFAHCLSAFYYMPRQPRMLLISCDGGGDGTMYSAYSYTDQQFDCLIGGDAYILKPQNPGASIGLAYAYVTELLGYQKNRHEGKITGLAAFGQPSKADEILANFTLDKHGVISSPIESAHGLKAFLKTIVSTLSKEDAAASIQKATETLLCRWVQTLQKRFPATHIGMAGGVFSNVLVNQKIAALPDIESVFIFPAMTDDGLPVGNCVASLLRTQGLAALPEQRLQDVYFGRAYTPERLCDEALQAGYTVHKADSPAELAAQLLCQHKIGAIYTARMEMGPRALGARSIIASPTDRTINQSLNDRLNRTEFMPFAPYVRDKDANTVFEITPQNQVACRFMTITTQVRSEYHDKIPAVVHIDGTARPQIIDRDTNPLYYDILTAFERDSGIPCLINTSFNAHEEPIVDTPAQALRALQDKRIDFLVTDTAVITGEDCKIKAG